MEFGGVDQGGHPRMGRRTGEGVHVEVGPDSALESPKFDENPGPALVGKLLLLAPHVAGDSEAASSNTFSGP